MLQTQFNVSVRGLLDVILDNDGITYSLTSGQIPHSGFAVSIPGHEERVPWLTPQIVADYIERNSEALKGPGAFLGAWNNDGEWYLDVSRVVHDEELAMRLGAAWNQQAIFDVARKLPLIVPTWRQYHDSIGQAELPS